MRRRARDLAKQIDPQGGDDRVGHSVDPDSESVECGGHAAWQLGLEIGVKVVVRQMCQKGSLRADGARHLDRLGHAQVRRMLGTEQGVDDQYVVAPLSASMARLGDRLFASVT